MNDTRSLNGRNRKSLNGNVNFNSKKNANWKRKKSVNTNLNATSSGNEIRNVKSKKPSQVRRQEIKSDEIGVEVDQEVLIGRGDVDHRPEAETETGEEEEPAQGVLIGRDVDVVRLPGRIDAALTHVIDVLKPHDVRLVEIEL